MCVCVDRNFMIRDTDRSSLSSKRQDKMSNKKWENSTANTIHLVDNISSIILRVFWGWAQENKEVSGNQQTVTGPIQSQPRACRFTVLSTSHKHNTLPVFVSTSIQTVTPTTPSTSKPASVLLPSDPSPAPPFPGA